MMRRPLLSTVAIASLGAARLASAQDDFSLGEIPPSKPPAPFYQNHIELGAGWQSENSYYFARYGGVPDRGLFGIADIGLAQRDPWDSGGTRYWNADIIVAGFDRIEAILTAGNQGHWKATGFYDDFTRYFTEHAATPFDGIGTDHLTLPANWVGGNASLRFTNLAADIKPLALKTRWQTGGGDFTLKPWDGYEVNLHIEERHRDGLKPQSITFGPESNFPVGVFFPMPIDYDTTRVNASFGFASPRLTWTLSYGLSLFEDARSFISVPNPYARSLGTPWPAGAFAGYPFAFGQYNLPPDSTANQFMAAGAMTLTPTTRVTGRLSYTIQTQNDPFLPYTPSPDLSVPAPLPRNSLNGRVDKTYANLGVTSQPWTSVDMAASYSYDDRNNKTPRDLYSYVADDSQDQPMPPVPGVSRFIRYNIPHSFTFQQAKTEVGYRPAPGMRLSLSYSGDFRIYDDQEVHETDEHTFRAKALSMFGETSAWVAYSFAIRTGTNYQDDLPWNESHTTNYLNAGPQDQSIEYPLLRKYNLADRQRHEAKGGLTLPAGRGLTLDVEASYAKDNYTHSLFGLRKGDAFLADGDLSYAIANVVTASAFYSFESIGAAQTGYYIATTNENNPAQVWNAQNRDFVHTGGLKIDWDAIPHVLKLGTSYSVSYAWTQIGVQATAFTPLATTAPMPDADSVTHTATLTAEYMLKSNITLKGGYTLQRHVTNDWSYLGGLTPVAQLLGSGDLPPRYTQHVVWASARYSF